MGAGADEPTVISPIEVRYKTFGEGVGTLSGCGLDVNDGGCFGGF